jgi:Xaa-Pro aminopeptidase
MERMDETEIGRELLRRRDAVAGAWGLTDQVVLIGAGEPIHRPGRDDMTYRYESHSEYYYLTDRNRPGGVLAFDPAEGWVEFVAPVTVEERLWSGAPDAEPEGPTTDDLPGWLEGRRGRPAAWLGSVPPDARSDPSLAMELRFGLATVRRLKDPVELERMRVAQRATRAAFAAVVPRLSEGISERQVQVELEAEALRHGAEAMAYDTIVGSGPNSAVLHFPPSSRQLRNGELVLIDAGAQYLGYASDITRTYPAGGAFTPEQQELHAVVHQAEVAAIQQCQAGVEWRDIHLVAALVIAEGLASFGLLNGNPESLVESGAVWLFFPHGIGHLLGLGVRDAGGTPLRERRDDPKPYPNLRIDLPLEPGMVVTVEPGIYFVPAILNDPEKRRAHHDHVNWDKVGAMLDFGGIRIEDNLVIGEEGYEIITADVPIT